MNDDTFGPDVFAESAEVSDGRPRRPLIENSELADKADKLLARRADYVNFAEAYREFWMRVDVMGPRERDQWIEWLYEQYLLLAPHLGVSLMGLPQLRECCGQKRETLGALLEDPSKTLFGTAALPARVASSPIPPHVEELAWWPGDIIRRITRFFGFPYCETCDQRRRWINSWFGKRY